VLTAGQGHALSGHKTRQGLRRLRQEDAGARPARHAQAPRTSAREQAGHRMGSRKLCRTRLRTAHAKPDKDVISQQDGSWLGRLDSNQGMAESKSGSFCRFAKARSENYLEFALRPINRLAADSECRRCLEAVIHAITTRSVSHAWPYKHEARSFRPRAAVVGLAPASGLDAGWKPNRLFVMASTSAWTADRQAALLAILGPWHPGDGRRLSAGGKTCRTNNRPVTTAVAPPHLLPRSRH